MSIMVYFCAVFFPRGVLDEILNLIESISEGFLFFTAAGVVLCDGRKTSPRKSFIVQIIFHFCPLKSVNIF